MSIHFVAIAIQCILLLTLSTHWCACLWYVIACPGGECHTETWADSAGGSVMLAELPLQCKTYNMQALPTVVIITI